MMDDFRDLLNLQEEHNQALYNIALQENKIVFIAGRVDNRNGELKIVADDAQEIVTHEA